MQYILSSLASCIFLSAIQNNKKELQDIFGCCPEYDDELSRQAKLQDRDSYSNHINVTNINAYKKHNLKSNPKKNKKKATLKQMIKTTSTKRAKRSKIDNIYCNIS